MYLNVGNKIFDNGIKEANPKTTENINILNSNNQSKAIENKTKESDSFKAPIDSKTRFSQNSSLNDVLQGKKYLSKGCSGEDVTLIQQALGDMGYYPGDAVDGKFGNQTAIALKNFQDNRGIKPTGIVDKQTMTELNKITPPQGKKLWDKSVITDLIQTTKDEKIAPSNTIGNTKRAKIVIDLSEHRLFLYDNDNSIKKVYSIASGKGGWADGRGNKTKAGIKVVDSKNSDPSQIANQLWPETKGKAFGTKLLGLSFINPETGKRTNSGEELHGTFARNSVGTDASHGCMRMQNEDIEEVFKQVKTGDLIKIQD